MYFATILLVLCVTSLSLALPVEEKKADESNDNGLTEREATHEIGKRDVIEVVWRRCRVRYWLQVTLTVDVVVTVDRTFHITVYSEQTNELVAEATIIILAYEVTATITIKWRCEITVINTFIVWCDTFSRTSGILGDDCYEPHLTTFDGYKYNYHGYCSYTMMKNRDDTVYPPFEVIADFRAKDPKHPYSPPTFMVALDVIINGEKLIRVNEDDSVLVEGKPMTDTSAVIGVNQGKVDQGNGEVTIRLPHVGFTLNYVRRRHGMTIELDRSLAGKVCGLLGDADGNPHNDFTKPDGQRTFISEEFGNSWEIPGSCP